MNIYGVYDMNYKEQLVRIGSIKEVITFLDIPVRSFDKLINNNKLYQNKYKLLLLFEE